MEKHCVVTLQQTQNITILQAIYNLIAPFIFNHRPTKVFNIFENQILFCLNN